MTSPRHAGRAIRGESILPCSNNPRVTAQIEPAARLLSELDTRFPDILLQSGVDPQDYRNGLVFSSAIESIRGHYAASRTGPREQLVGDCLAAMCSAGLLASFSKTPVGVRHDFDCTLDIDPERSVAIEVKGGEGNSLNVSNRPEGVAEFIVWCHLDGSLQHSPGRSVRQIIGRIVADIVKAPKRVDALIVKDSLCGTRVRPCPKYSNDRYPALGPAPDVFLFPSAQLRFGVTQQPKPHTRASCAFPFRLLQLHGVAEEDVVSHVSEVGIRLYYDNGRPMREVTVCRGGKELFRSRAAVEVRS